MRLNIEIIPHPLNILMVNRSFAMVVRWRWIPIVALYLVSLACPAVAEILPVRCQYVRCVGRVTNLR